MVAEALVHSKVPLIAIRRGHFRVETRTNLTKGMLGTHILKEIPRICIYDGDYERIREMERNKGAVTIREMRKM